MMGNLNVSNVRGSLVRAHISSEGDITLTNIASTAVAAENVIGDIFFDGTVQAEGNYRFTSTRGNINLRIPFNSSFQISRHRAFDTQHFAWRFRQLQNEIRQRRAARRRSIRRRQRDYFSHQPTRQHFVYPS